ncbi:hypothetical protein [Paenibacillus gansuensis]|uniref:DUF4760 domain-containing protein n=1 Tax=Paenibacillus gansuensis TaxID=306542 RepID=A0ABW5PAJ3_9BACL
MTLWLITGLLLAMITFYIVDGTKFSEAKLNLFITIVGTVAGVILAFIAEDLRQQSDDREQIIGLLHSSMHITQQRVEKVKLRLVYAQSEIYSETAMKVKYPEIAAIQANDEIFTVLLHNGELFMKLSHQLRRHIPVFMDNAHWFDATYQPNSFENDRFIEYILAKYLILLEQQIDYVNLEMKLLKGTLKKKEFDQQFQFLEDYYLLRIERLKKVRH